MLNHIADSSQGEKILILIENIVSINTLSMIKIPPIVGVQAFSPWSFANSIAFPMSHSSRICFHIFSCINMGIPDRTKKSVRKNDIIRDARIKKRLDMRSNSKE
jgi:hypothetical protein